jgi:hypothetical protein
MTALICDIDGVLLHDNLERSAGDPRTNGKSRSGVGTESLEELDLSGVVEIVGGHAADEGADRGSAA